MIPVPVDLAAPTASAMVSSEVAPLVVITRARQHSQGLAASLSEIGYAVTHFPVTEIVPAADGGAALRVALAEDWQWLVLTSANALRAVLDNTSEPRPWQIATVGPATAQAVLAAGWSVDLVASAADAESLAAELIARCPPGTRMLLPQADNARPLLRHSLHGAGMVVEAPLAYESRPVADPQAFPAQAQVVTFASSATVARWVEMLGIAQVEALIAKGCRWVAIGRHTAAACVAHGLQPLTVASAPTAEGLAAAVQRAHPL